MNVINRKICAYAKSELEAIRTHLDNIHAYYIREKNHVNYRWSGYPDHPSIISLRSIIIHFMEHKTI